MIRQTDTSGAGAALDVAWSPEMVDKIVSFTQTMFPGGVRCQPEFDPEDPRNRFLVFTVCARGEAQEVVDHRCQWHRHVQQLRPDFDYRLSIESD